MRQETPQTRQKDTYRSAEIVQTNGASSEAPDFYGESRRSNNPRALRLRRRTVRCHEKIVEGPEPAKMKHRQDVVIAPRRPGNPEIASHTPTTLTMLLASPMPTNDQ